MRKKVEKKKIYELEKKTERDWYKRKKRR